MTKEDNSLDNTSQEGRVDESSLDSSIPIHLLECPTLRVSLVCLCSVCVSVRTG